MLFQRATLHAIILTFAYWVCAMACMATAQGQETPRVLLVEQERLVKAKTPGEGTIDTESDSSFDPVGKRGRS